MPRIESDYTAQISNLPNLSSQSFVDTRGAQSLTQGLSDVSNVALEIRQQERDLVETEKKLAQARMLAEGRQRWMLNMDDRVATAEQTGNYKGLIESFDKEYTGWADGVLKGIPEGNEREAMRVSLIEMQTPFLGQASNYVARKRGEKIKINHD